MQSFLSSPARDAYGDLLQDTRGLRREQQQARDAWFARLPSEKKDDLLFELEILLKGVACFANPRNQPGPLRRAPILVQDYHEALLLVRDGLARVVQLSRLLLGDRDRAFAFQRYLETVVPEDTARTRLVREGMVQNSPDEALFVLRHGMTNQIEIIDGLLRLPRVPFRIFYAICVAVQREIGANAYFNPLIVLEFRPEFDRITSRPILDLITQAPGEQAHRFVALSFLSLFRMLRYLRLLDAISRDLSDTRRLSGRAYLVFSVLRSDARALSSYLRRCTGAYLADSYEKDLLRVPAKELRARHDQLLADGYKLLSIRGALEAIAASLRLEMRRTFEHEIPPPEQSPSVDEMKTRISQASRNLSPAIQNAILFLARSLGVRLDENGVFDEKEARRLLSDRLRRDVWIFARILHAFVLKARYADPTEDRWAGAASFRFVQEFLSYFKAMGYPLLRGSDYPRFNEFLHTMSALSDTDLLDPARLDAAIEEADAFQAFLNDLFEQVSRREELAEIPFDRKAAAHALKLYLGT